MVQEHRPRVPHERGHEPDKTKRKRGRPRKYPTRASAVQAGGIKKKKKKQAARASSGAGKRARGRPRKPAARAAVVVTTAEVEEECSHVEADDDGVTAAVVVSSYETDLFFDDALLVPDFEFVVPDHCHGSVIEYARCLCRVYV